MSNDTGSVHSLVNTIISVMPPPFKVPRLDAYVAKATWPRIARFFRCAFRGLNGGLAAMFVLRLFPAGFMQLTDVAQNGYWHARSLAYTKSRWPSLFEWFRLPSDVVFIAFGAIQVLLRVFLAYVHLWTDRPSASSRQPV